MVHVRKRFTFSGKIPRWKQKLAENGSTILLLIKCFISELNIRNGGHKNGLLIKCFHLISEIIRKWET